MPITVADPSVKSKHMSEGQDQVYSWVVSLCFLKTVAHKFKRVLYLGPCIVVTIVARDELISARELRVFRNKVKRGDAPVLAPSTAV
jgi:hypothetical protein